MKFKDATVFVWVEEWERGLEFYKDVLGCTKVYESEGWAELKIPGLKETFIALNHWKGEGEMPPNAFLTLRVEKLDDLMTLMRERGIRQKGEVYQYMEEDQGMRLVKYLDPDGNVIAFCETGA